MKNKKLLDTQDVAARLREMTSLKINPATIRRLIREGKIETAMGGPPYFIKSEALKDIVPLLRPQGRPSNLKKEVNENVKSRPN